MDLQLDNYCGQNMNWMSQLYTLIFYLNLRPFIKKDDLMNWYSQNKCQNFSLLGCNLHALSHTSEYHVGFSDMHPLLGTVIY